MAMAATLLGCMTLAGVAAGTSRLVTPIPGWEAMSISTAFLCLVLSAGLAADAFGRYRLTRCLGVSTFVFVGALLIAHVIAGHDIISATLLSMIGRSFLTGETSMATGFCAILLAVGSIWRPQAQPAAILAVAVLLVTGIAILGYAYGVRELYALSPFRTMSLQTAVAFFRARPRLPALEQPSWRVVARHGSKPYGTYDTQAARIPDIPAGRRLRAPHRHVG